MIAQKEALAILQRLLSTELKRNRLSHVHPFLYSNNILVRSLATTRAKTKAAVTKQQTWRKTRKKVGPTTDKTVEDLDAESKLDKMIEYISKTTEGTTKESTDAVIATTTTAPTFTETNDTDDNQDIDKEDIVTTHWVPPAYRGLVDKSNGNSNRMTHKGRFQTTKMQGGIRPRKIRKSRTDRYVLDSKGEGVVDVPVLGLPEKAVIAKKQKIEFINTSMNDLLTAAKSYRSNFQQDVTNDTDDDDSNSDNAIFSGNINPSIQQRVVSCLQSIHGNGKLLYHDTDIQQTSPDFIHICRLLRQICSTACSLSTLRKYNDKDSTKYINLAEATMIELVQIISDRKEFLHNHKNNVATTEDETEAQNDTMKRIAEFMQIVNSSNVELNPNQTSEKDGSITKWFNEMIERISPIVKKVESIKMNESDNPVDTKKYLVNGHEIASAKLNKDKKDSKDDIEMVDDTFLQSMKRILRIVLTCIESTTKRPDVPLNASHLAIEVEDYEKVAQRLVNLLDRTSSLNIYDSGTIQYVMEFLSYCGKLRCAQLCDELYQKYNDDNCRISFAIVLEAYLETVKQEKDPDALLDIVEEVMNVVVAKWNKAKPTHRVDRLLQCAVVLNCLAVADMGKVSGMCESSDLLVKRAMGGKGFATFWEHVKTDTPNDENLYLPIANYLAQLYATSGTKSLEETSSLLLQYTMRDSDGFNAMTNYPTSETCNAVLKTLVKSSQEEHSTVTESNYIFAQKILKFMFTKAEMGCCPNETTYDCFFSILEAANPKDIGVVADEWISFIETSNLFYVSSTYSLPIKIYNRALECYLYMAKNQDVVDERHIPYRRAIHIIRKLEIRSKPLVLHPAVLGETAVESLYFANLRPNRNTYLLALQICANTNSSQEIYQEEAAYGAIEIYQTMVRNNVPVTNCWEVVIENCTNTKLIEKLKGLNFLKS